MKWITATNETSVWDDDFFKQLQVAVLSLRENTTFEPYLVYDGKHNERTAWIERHGVTIISHTLSFSSQVAEHIYSMDVKDPDWLIQVRTGAYLKMEIPEVALSNGIRDQFVLYTDCDVIFLKEPQILKLKPRFLFANGHRQGPIWSAGFWKRHFNTGVMILNLRSLCNEASAFRKFILSNGAGKVRPAGKFMNKNLFLSDQVAVNLYYDSKIQYLPDRMNWCPQLGIRNNAEIIHFNGLKWTQWEDLHAGRFSPEKQHKLMEQASKNMASYEYYSTVARRFLNKSSN